MILLDRLIHAKAFRGELVPLKLKEFKTLGRVSRALNGPAQPWRRR